MSNTISIIGWSFLGITSLNFLGFIYSLKRKSDKVTDLTYSLSFGLSTSAILLYKYLKN